MFIGALKFVVQLEFLASLVLHVLFIVNEAQIVMAVWVVRINLNPLLVFYNGFIQLILAKEDIAQSEVGIGVVRVFHAGLFKLALSLIEIAGV